MLDHVALHALVIQVFDDLLCDFAVCLHNDLVDLLRGFDRLGLIVNPVKLLKSATLRLNTDRISTLV